MLGEDIPMTIGELNASGQRLGLKCQDCHRFRYMRAARYPVDTKIAVIGGTLRCAQCGSKNVQTFAVARHAETGYWPAEGN